MSPAFCRGLPKLAELFVIKDEIGGEGKKWAFKGRQLKRQARHKPNIVTKI